MQTPPLFNNLQWIIDTIKACVESGFTICQQKHEIEVILENCVFNLKII